MFHLYPPIRTPEDTIMSGNVSTDFLEAMHAYLRAPVTDDPVTDDPAAVVRGHLEARIDTAARYLSDAAADPGVSYLMITELRAMAAANERRAELRALADDTPTA
jgi:hypothetical protein